MDKITGSRTEDIVASRADDFFIHVNVFGDAFPRMNIDDLSLKMHKVDAFGFQG
jgi:hypothetical protein